MITWDSLSANRAGCAGTADVTAPADIPWRDDIQAGAEPWGFGATPDGRAARQANSSSSLRSTSSSTLRRIVPGTSIGNLRSTTTSPSRTW